MTELADNDADVQGYEQLQRTFKRAAEHLMEIFVTPEVRRRQEAGTLEKPLNLIAAQVIFYPDDRKPEVRINSEVKAVAKMKLKAGVSKDVGDPVYSNELEGLENIQLPPEDDPDCAHATLLKLNEQWLLGFDFIYNKGLAAQHLQRAEQFLEAAEFSLTQKNWAAFVDNLFSAAELAAKSELLTVMPALREKSTHKAIHQRYNWFAHLGNVDPTHRNTFNLLAQMRYPARYVEGDVEVTEDQAEEFVGIVQRMLGSVRALIIRTPSNS